MRSITRSVRTTNGAAERPKKSITSWGGDTAAKIIALICFVFVLAVIYEPTILHRWLVIIENTLLPWEI